MVKLKDVKHRVGMDQGWAEFSIAHDIKIDYFMTSKVLKGHMYKVNIFVYNMTEVVKKYPQHDPTLAIIWLLFGLYCVAYLSNIC
jgi:hypothetical protein